MGLLDIHKNGFVTAKTLDEILTDLDKKYTNALQTLHDEIQNLKTQLEAEKIVVYQRKHFPLHGHSATRSEQ